MKDGLDEDKYNYANVTVLHQGACVSVLINLLVFDISDVIIVFIP